LFHALGLKYHHIDHQMDDIAHQTFIKSSYFCPKAQELPSLITPPITFFLSLPLSYPWPFLIEFVIRGIVHVSKALLEL
jgi:hypothetical protein